MKIILVRHAQTINNKEGIAQSHSDSELTKEGQIQLQKTKMFLKEYKIDAIFCSDLDRSFESAKIISEPHKLKPIIDDRLKEINWG